MTSHKNLKKWQLAKIKRIIDERPEPDYIIDWHIDIGILWLKENRYDYRIVSKDGIDFILTHDFNPNRVNLYIVKGFITKIDIG